MSEILQEVADFCDIAGLSLNESEILGNLMDAYAVQAINDFLNNKAPRLPPFEDDEEAKEKYHCEWNLYQERERLHNLAAKIGGGE